MPAKTSSIPARLTLIFAGVFLFILTLHLAGGAVLRYFVERELHPALPKGTYIGEVHLNLFTGSLKVEGFELRNRGRLQMRFGELVADIDTPRLLTGAVRIERLELRHGYVLVERRPDGSFDLGLPALGAEGPPTPTAKKPDITLAGAQLEKVTIEYHDGDFSSVLYGESVEVGTYSMRADSQQIPLDWRLRWDNQTIDGEAVVALDNGQLAVSGKLVTELLDLARAQRLARIEPLASGKLAYQGPFNWSAPALQLGGAIQAPDLAYAAEGQSAQASGLEIAEFGLRLETAPKLTAQLDLQRPLKLAALNWQAAEQGAEAKGLSLGGTLGFAAAGHVEATQLALRATALAWHDAARAAEISGLAVDGTLRQSLAAAAGLPTLQASVTAADVVFADRAQGLDARVADLKVRELALTATDEPLARKLLGRVQTAAGRVVQAESQVDWSAVDASLSGRLAGEQTTIATDLRVKAPLLYSPELPNGPLKLSNVSAKGLNVGPSTRFNVLRLEGLELPARLPETALKIAAIDLNDGAFAEPQGVSIGAIVIDGLQTGVVRNKAGEWLHVMSGGKAAAARPAAGKVAGKEKAPGGDVAWKIGSLRVTGDSHLSTADYLNPDMSKPRFRIERLKVGALASKQPDRDTPFEIALRPDKYSEFRIDGVVRPLAKNLYLKADGHLHGFGLPTVNGLIANDLGHRFLKGQLDDDFTITIDKNRLDMGNKLSLAQVNVEEISGKEGPPLGTAIALLEDRDGNIKLEVPVNGDLGDPDFRVLGALNPIIMKAVAGTAALAIQPLGSVLLVGSLLANQALKVTFEPALFDPGSTELNSGAKTYLGQLAGKLKEKPKLAVRVCGVVAETERSKDKKGNYLDKPEDLLAVAQQRADAARAYLTGQGAGSKQLRVCRPSLDAAPEGRPRVDIRF